jgi:hypothetical protein
MAFWVMQLRKEIQLGMGKESSFLNVVFGKLHYVKILITWGGLGFGEKLEINFLGRVVREECSVKWILVSNLAFDVRQRKATEQIDLGGLSDAC